MNTVVFLKFFGELNDFLPPEKKENQIIIELKGSPSIKHMIEALGVPHTEAGTLNVNGSPVDFSYLLQPGDQIDVYPARSADTPGNLPLDSDNFNAEPRFILDQHLGRLAVYLRMLGFDTLYRNDYADDELAEVASQEERILVTRDRRLLMRRTVQRGCCLHSLDSRCQLAEVVQRYRLANITSSFKRCLRCNTPLQPTPKEAILHRLEPLTRLYYHEFAICPSCDQVYWKGSHYEHMLGIIEKVMADDSRAN
jgi:uncharacterized protein with PIN domain